MIARYSALVPPRFFGESTIEILIELLLEIVGELFFELLVTFGAETFTAGLRDRSPANAAPARFGYFVIGLICGALSGWFFPSRLLRNDVLALSTLVINPLIAGVAARHYGLFRRRTGHKTTHLATFAGGLALALGVSLGRILLVFW